MPLSCRADRQQAGGHLLAGRDHRVILPRVVQRRQFGAPLDQLVGDAGHGGDDDGDLVAVVHLALDALGDVADAVKVGDGGAAEFHHDAGHEGESVANCCAGAHILTRGGGSNIMSSGTVSAEEVDKFDRLASRWWDPNGPMKPLHRMNPARIGWIEGLLHGPTRVLDVGCGAGLAAEALARHGHDVLGIDAAGEAIEAARAHADGAGTDADLPGRVWPRTCSPRGALPGDHLRWRSSSMCPIRPRSCGCWPGCWNPVACWCCPR